MSEAEPRAICARCMRPEVVCYCKHIVPLETKTKVVVLQHSRERDVPINTARIAALCLPQSEVHVGVRFGAMPAVTRALSDPARPAALLYPGPDAIDVEEHPPSGPITLVVVDGTWWQAKKLVKENPALAALPRYAFRPRAPSDYRIRREPREDYVSTIEALAHVLGVLEGDEARFLSMLAPFRAMVDAQIHYAKNRAGARRMLSPERRARRKKDPRARIPAILRERAGDLVCAYGEANGVPYGSPDRILGSDELVHWLACRVSTGEIFERVVATKRTLAPGTPRHVGLPREEIEQGISSAQLIADWSKFLGPNDVVCTWSAYAPGLLVRDGGSLGATPIDLRIVARSFYAAKVGTMEELLGRFGANQNPPTLGRGRGGKRLAQLVEIARWFARE